MADSAVDAPDADGSPLADVDLDAGPIVLFDGVCNLCSGVVRFLVPRDPDGVLRFASLQSPVGQALLERFDLPTEAFDSFVLVDGEDCHTKSAAALRVARRLDAPWSWLWTARVVPRPLRDAVYDLVAATRYDVFGRTDRCMVPEPGVRERFLGDGIEAASEGSTADD
jgi:predicted DCC family thiol-disulfide oxidoreductase YuxK